MNLFRKIKDFFNKLIKNLRAELHREHGGFLHVENIIAELKKQVNKYNNARLKFVEKVKEYKSHCSLYIIDNPNLTENFKKSEKEFKETEMWCREAIKEILRNLTFWDVLYVLMIKYKKEKTKEQVAYTTAVEKHFSMSRIYNSKKGKEIFNAYYAIVLIIVLKVNIIVAEVWLNKINYSFSYDNEADIFIYEKIKEEKHSFINDDDLEYIRNRNYTYKFIN
ncbi:MAG: hypothetical protein FWG44_00205 [Oscillospiraceae bacterium]|nr:hypothetical protein [Oscillospiraceae bacterium]